MRLLVRIAIGIVGLVVGVPLLSLALLVAAGNTDPGRDLLAGAVSTFSGGTVSLEGLSGRFPDDLHIRRLVVTDPQGAWLTVEGAVVLWSPLQLLHGEAQIEALTAERVAVARRPAASAEGGSGGSLPLRVAVARFEVARLDLAAPVAGAVASLTAKGDLHAASPEDASLTLDARRLDGNGTYRLSAALSEGRLTGRLAVEEPANGLISALAGLPDLGPLSASASLDGPRDAEAVRFAVSAGPLEAEGHGRLDLAGQTLDLDVTGAAPAMTPAPGLSWQSVRVEAHLHGSFAAPGVTGHFEIAALRAGGGSVEEAAGDIAGNSGSVSVDASATQVRLPGGASDLFAAAPFALHAQVKLNQAQRPVTFTLSHPLVGVSGTVDIAGTPSGSVTVTWPALAPFTALAGTDIQGHASLTARLAYRDDAATIGADGTLAITGGMPAAAALIGDQATLALNGSLRDGNVTLDRLALDGKTLQLAAKGTETGGKIDLDWQAALSDLSAVAATVAGTLSAQGHVEGTPQDLAVNADVSADAAVAGWPKGKVTASLTAQGLPGAPSGKIAAEGTVAGSPLQLAAAANRQSDGTLDVSLDRLGWKSVSGDGRLTLPAGAIVPLGRLNLRVAQLADLAPLTGLAAKGGIDAALETVEQQGRTQLRVRANARNIALASAAVDRVTLDGQIVDPTTRPSVTATLAADGMRQGSLAGNARLTASGTMDSLALKVSSDMRVAQQPAKLSTAATANLTRRSLQIATLEAGYGGMTARLLGPARLDLANGTAIDGLRLGVGGAMLAVSGRITPTLDLTVSARDITPAVIKPLVPGLNAAGSVNLDGRLRGTIAAPEGAVRLSGRGLRATTGPAAALPAATIDANATLTGSAARIDARLAAGSTANLTLAGTAPLQPSAPLSLRLGGNAELAMLDPLLTPNGRTAAGQATVDLGIAGTATAPRITGTVRLANSSIQDYVQGFRITKLSGTIEAAGDSLRISQLSGTAGSGTLSASGTIGILEPSVPVSLSVTARNAQLLASDLLTATADAALTLKGNAEGSLTVGGAIRLARTEINIPNAMPQGVAVLHVRRPGQQPRAQATAGSPDVTLALSVEAPGEVFVRGHGVDAVMAGTLKLSGTAAAPRIDGGFDLRRGTFSLAGQTLTFTSGRVAFAGTGLAGKIDPTLNFVAQTSAGNITATLTLTGYADAPKIQLSSTPDLPQDEILGRLLFGQSTQRLSPFQMAAVAQALASFGGVGGGDPLASVRDKLGLDRLSVGSAPGNGTGASIEAGKYVANGVYVGARQGTSGGSQAQVQVDLTKHLKLQTTLGTGGGTPATGLTPDNDPGSSIGLTYSFEY